MEESQNFSLCGKAAVTEANLRDEYYWKLVADFIGPQSGEGLDLEVAPCRNRLLIQVGLLREDNNFPWIAIVEWLKKIFPSHYSADFRRLIERGIATTLSLGSDARLTFLESDANFNFVGPICDSIGVERQHLLEMKDFSERGQSIEVTNGLILELSNFVAREKIAPVILVTWLRNFNPEFCKNGNVQKAYTVLKAKIKKLKLHYRNYETRSHRRNVAMENLLQSPFELVRKRMPRLIVKKRIKREDSINYEKVTIKEEYESCEISQGEGSEMNACGGRDKDLDIQQPEESSDKIGESLTLLDIAMLSVQKLSSVYGGKTTTCKQVSLDLLRNQYTLTCKEHPAMEEFEKNLTYSVKITLASPVVFLNYNANFLVDIHDTIEQQIMSFEKEIVHSTEQKLGRDNLPKFRTFDECPNIILESVAADANDSVIQSLVCVLAIIYCKVLGPYWQLLKSGGEYSLYSKYMLWLYQKFLNWSKDPSTLLEPEEGTNVFLQFPLQEKSFNGVFHYCDSSQEDDDRSGSSDRSSDESSGWHDKKNADQQDDYSPQSKKGKKERVPKEEPEEIMDLDYITATVTRNGGPCKTQQDVDKMLLQFDGKPRAERREAIRCEILYQKMILNNNDRNLDTAFNNRSQMLVRLKLSLPRIKPGYSLVLAPRKTKIKPAPKRQVGSSS
ncbi:hypothetical protein D5F01_LYC19859 [Larimichthys crocea]|uniref:Uncharacterized protein n=1 Tax=Larimichthys crocea TaxID=215358 RepID=A0A6G0HTE1_LARCR|nr:hypothetical protein D5F01_LYC19859 [Larimichthys crocea]